MKENVENASCRRVFSLFLKYSEMFRMIYHSLVHGLGFFICFMIWILHPASRNNKASKKKTKKDAFSVLHSDKTRVTRVHRTYSI